LPERPSSSSSSSNSSGVVKGESVLRVPEDAPAQAPVKAARPRARRRGTAEARLRAIFPSTVWLTEVIEKGDAKELAEMSEFIASRRVAEKGVAGSQPSLVEGDEEEKDTTDGKLPLLASDARA
jgi:hypothetical protein